MKGPTTPSRYVQPAGSDNKLAQGRAAGAARGVQGSVSGSSMRHDQHQHCANIGQLRENFRTWCVKFKKTRKLIEDISVQNRY